MTSRNIKVCDVMGPVLGRRIYILRKKVKNLWPSYKSFQKLQKSILSSGLELQQTCFAYSMESMKEGMEL